MSYSRLFLTTVLLLRGPVTADFVHPGLLHTRADLERMRAGIAKGEGTIFAGFEVLKASGYAQADYRMRGPLRSWGRGRGSSGRQGEASSDATAAYENALMWALTRKSAHAAKAIEIVNSWSDTLERVDGIDGILGSGLQGFKFVNAAELLRYTASGWSEAAARRAERSFMDAWIPKIENYAYFANGNWEGAALQMKMATAIYCNDREMFERTVRYAVNGAGNGSIPHTVVYSTGQAQETTRKQGYAQLGLGLLCSAAEVSWNQGVDLYGWRDNRLLRGFEYTAKYGLGEHVPYRHYLDRTGKYGFGGRNNNYDRISTDGRGRFRPIFEMPLGHYAGRRGIPAPYLRRVVGQKRPERRSGDHSGYGTLVHSRPAHTPHEANPASASAGRTPRAHEV